MSFWEDFASLFESEQERLRKLYAAGHPLPPKPEPSWVRSQPRTEIGMVRLPHLSRIDGMGFTFETSFWSVFLIAIGAFLLWIGYTSGSYFMRDGTNPMHWLGAACFIGAFLAWLDQVARLAMRPEAARVIYSPGDTILVMLPSHPKSPAVTSARLIFRERWMISSGNTTEWKARNLSEIPVQFARSVDNLLTASIGLPADAAPSYHTTYYRHEWLLAIAHVNVWGFTRTDHYLLWIAP